jgi:hypothetical protein
VYNTASAKLPVTFDITSQTANLFCDALSDRANKSGWYAGEGNILNIPDSTTTNRDIIKEYGRLTIADITAHVTTYINGNSRRTQNSAQMLSCIKESLSDAGKLKILSESDKWKVNGKESGVLLFKIIMQKAVVDTRATSSFFRENLTSLDAYIMTIDSNISFSINMSTSIELVYRLEAKQRMISSLIFLKPTSASRIKTSSNI